MNRVFHFIEFFSRIEVEFFYFGKVPIEKSDLYSSDWDFKFFNGKSAAEFNEEIREFSSLIIELENELKVGTNSYLKGISQNAIRFVLIKAEELANKVSTRGKVIFSDHERVWYFNDPEILKVACRFSEKEPHKAYQNFPALIDHVEELISEDIHWIKQCLDRLVLVFKCWIAPEVAAERNAEGVEAKVNESSNPSKISTKSSQPAKYAGPKNFKSPNFHYDAAKALFGKLVDRGYLLDKPDQKRSFCKVFSENALDKWVNPKIRWQGDQTTLRGFIRYFTDIVDIPNNRDFKWNVADKSFKVKGCDIQFTVDKANGHYGPPTFKEEIKRVIELSIKEEKPSED